MSPEAERAAAAWNAKQGLRRRTEATKFKAYLGDGVYVGLEDDGTVWLWTDRAEGRHAVALEPAVRKELVDYLNGDKPL